MVQFLSARSAVLAGILMAGRVSHPRQASTRDCGAEAADPVVAQRRVPAYRHLAEHMGLARIEQRSDEARDW